MTTTHYISCKSSMLTHTFSFIYFIFYLKVDISLSFQRRSFEWAEFLAQVHRDLKRILFALKRKVSLLFWVHKNTRRVFTDSK